MKDWTLKPEFTACRGVVTDGVDVHTRASLSFEQVLSMMYVFGKFKMWDDAVMTHLLHSNRVGTRCTLSA